MIPRRMMRHNAAAGRSVACTDFASNHGLFRRENEGVFRIRVFQIHFLIILILLEPDGALGGLKS